MDDSNEPDIQIGDVDSFRSDKNQVYSHQALIMQSKRRVIELGGHELCEGIQETIIDPIKKITKIVYKEDTKRAFINAVQMIVTLMECDYDKEAEEKIKALEDSIEEKYQELLKQQNIAWENASPRTRKSYDELSINLSMNNTTLHKALPFYLDFVNFEIKIHMKIFSELNKLAKRLNFYEMDIFEN